MTVFDAIAEAESLLHLKPAKKGKDPRWQAIIKVGEFISNPSLKRFGLSFVNHDKRTMKIYSKHWLVVFWKI
jgi:hypothetical protein